MLRRRFFRTYVFLTGLFACFLALLYARMLSVFILSFQGEGGGLTFPLRGTSLHWFKSVFVEQQSVGDIWGALGRSFILAIVFTIATLRTCFLAGLAFRRPFFGD